MSGDQLFNAKELVVLAQLRANLINAVSNLTKTELSLLPAEADWKSSIEHNGPAEWEAYARSLRRAAYAYQCDPKIDPRVQTALSQLAMPIHGRLLRDNSIPVFDEAPDDLVFPEAKAELYKQEIAALHDELSRLRRQKESAVDENLALLAQIDQLRKDLADEKARVDRLIEQGRGWQITILSNLRLRIGDISLGGEWWDSAITLIRDKAIRDILIGNLKRTAKAGKQLFSALAKWGAQHSVESIKRGARDRIDSFHQLQKKLDAEGEAEAAPDGNPTPPPADFDYAQVYERLLSGQPIPAAWAPHVTRLDFRFTQLHHLGSDVMQRFSGQESAFARVGLLRNLANLQTLNLTGTQVADIEPLRNLANLQTLNLMNTQVADIEPLRNLASLEYLDLSGTQVTDIETLRNLANLQILNLTNTQVADIEPLRNLANLQILYLTGTQVADIEPLRNLANLQSLHLANTQVAYIEPLGNLASLEILDLESTQVTDIEPLRNLANLQSLYLTGTQVADIEPLRNLANLQYLNLVDTQVADTIRLVHLVEAGLQIMG